MIIGCPPDNSLLLLLFAAMPPVLGIHPAEGAQGVTAAHPVHDHLGHQDCQQLAEL